VLSSHALQVATINGLGDFILFLGKCLVTVITGCVGLFIFRSNPDLEFYAAPTLLVCVFAFLVAHCILSLYEVNLRKPISKILNTLISDGAGYCLFVHMSKWREC
jgi:hypothetical protein